MRIGTLSFEVYGDGPKFRLPSDERADTVAKIIRERDLALLVCAGHTVDSSAEIDALAARLRALRKPTDVVVEARDSSDSPTELRQFDITHQRLRGEKPSPRTHAMYLLKGNGERESLGPQWFGTSSELNRAEGSWRKERYVQHIGQKRSSSSFGTLFAVCCGEINVLRGPKKRGNPDGVHLRIPEVADLIATADITVNPTHDRMGYASLLDNKRRWLSERGSDGRQRTYVSASNWNSAKRSSTGKTIIHQRQDDPQLHTVYRSEDRWGNLAAFDRPYPSERDFEYREWEVS